MIIRDRFATAGGVYLVYVFRIRKLKDGDSLPEHVEHIDDYYAFHNYKVQ